MRVRCTSSVILAALLMASTCSAADQFAADNDFMRRAEQAATQEAKDAQAALKVSSNTEVRRIAKELQRDAAAVDQALAALAVQKGWPAPAVDSNGDAGAYSDRTYISGQIKAQQNAIALYTEQAANGADTDLQQFARDTLATLRRNVESLRSLRSI